MLELLDIRFKFSLRTSHQNSDGKSAIVLRITFLGKRSDIFTGLYCFELDWDRNFGRVLNSDASAKSLNENLAMILQGAKNSFDELKFSRQAFTLRELFAKIKGIQDRPVLLVDYLKERNKAMLKRVGTEIDQSTFNKYTRSVLYLQEFLESELKVKNLNLQETNVDLIERYFHFLRSDKNIAHNTACKYLACLKTLLLPALREGLLKSHPFYGLKITSKPVFRLLEFMTDKFRTIPSTLPEPLGRP